MMDVILLAGVLTLVILLLLRVNQRWKYMPPGPFGLPIIGYAPFMDISNPYKTFHKLSYKYGDIFSLTLVSKTIVVISDYNLMKATFARHSCNDRPNLEIVNILYDDKVRGILNTSGEYWAYQKKLLSRFLKTAVDSGSLEAIINAEAILLKDKLDQHCDNGPFIVNKYILYAVFQATWILVFGKRSTGYTAVENVVCGDASEFVGDINTLFFLGLLPKWLRDMIPNKLLKLVDELKAELGAYIEDEKIRWKTEKNMNATKWTFLQACLYDIEDPDIDNKNRTTEDDIKWLIFDFLVGGSETSASTVTLSLLYCAKYPDVQERLYVEIMAVTKEGILDANSYNSMNYYRSFIHEILRITTIIPLGLARTNNQDVIIKGYKIPKNSILIGNNFAVHNDTKIWGEEIDFKADRFLDSEGNFVSPKNGFVPFSTGKRQCPGMLIARMKMLLLLANILQNFKIISPNRETMNLETRPGIVLQAPNSEILIQKR